MNTAPLPELNVTWLINPQGNDAETSASLPPTTMLQRQEMPFPPNVGHGWMERLPLTDGLSLIHGVHKFEPNSSGSLLKLGEFDIDFPEESFCAQTIHGGYAHHQEFHPRLQLLFRPGHDLFRHAKRFHTIASIDTTLDSEMTALIIADSVLVKLLGADMTEMLMDRLALAAITAIKVMPMPMYISAPLRTAVSPKLQGQLKILFAQSKVLEYLCGLAEFVGVRDSALSVPTHGAEKARELRDYLMRLEGKLPTLEDLASKFGMSPRWLSSEFMKEYGQTFYSFIVDHRLNAAHVALMKSNVKIHTISESLGYSDSSNFTIAFKNKFGYPPSHLRKKGNAKDSQ